MADEEYQPKTMVRGFSRGVGRRVVAIQTQERSELADTQQPDPAISHSQVVCFLDLEKFRNVAGTDKRHEMFVATLRSADSPIRFDIPRPDFAKIEGAPLAYEHIGVVGQLFRTLPSLSPTFCDGKIGHQTFNDDRFVRCWWEVASIDRGASKTWPGFAKGGEFSRFYSDVYLVVRWDAEAHRTYGERRSNFNVLLTSSSSEYLYRPGLTWPRRTAKGLNVRRLPAGCIFSDKGSCLFLKDLANEAFVLGVLNSTLFEFVFRSKTSFSWEMGIMKSLPVPVPSDEQRKSIGDLAASITDLKSEWDRGNEVATTFVEPWIIDAGEGSIRERLEYVREHEASRNRLLVSLYADLNDAVYRLYSISERARHLIDESWGKRPPEFVWAQMEGKTAEQKRMEHVWRLLSYLVKRVVEGDEDGIVPFLHVSDEIPLIDRVHAEFAKVFPQREVTGVEVEIANELKRKVKGYDRAESIQEWIENVYFVYHASLYKNRPIFWHVASSQGKNRAAFAALVHYHRFDRDRMAKLRGTYLRETISVFRREAALALQEGRADDRLEWQTKLEEAENFDRQLQKVQEGFHQGIEDYRILTPWKTESEQPKGWDPDINDGVKVNIEPLQRAGVLRIAEVV